MTQRPSMSEIHVSSANQNNFSMCVLDLENHVESSDTHWFSSKRSDTSHWFSCFLLHFCSGTRFRPLSLEIPKPLFPIAGFPILYHLIESCAQVSDIPYSISIDRFFCSIQLRELREILLIGCYQPNEALSRFIANAQQTFNISIRYLRNRPFLPSEFHFF